MFTATPAAPSATGALAPSMSPVWGTAVPDFDTRAVTTMRAAFDSLNCGLIDIESSSLNLSGRSLTLARSTASGGPPPSGPCANTNSVSSAEAPLASAGAMVTVPLTEAPAATFAGSALADSTLAGAAPGARATASRAPARPQEDRPADG